MIVKFNPLHEEQLQLYPSTNEYDSRYVNIDGDTMTGNLVFSGSQKIIGGTSTTADLTLQTTSGIGATGADMHFLVGNNGATEAMTILNNGNVGVNTIAPDFKLDVALAAGSGQSVVGRFYKSGETNAFLQSVNFVTSATGGGFMQLAFARNTEASPAIIINGDRIGGFFFSGYDGDQFINGAGIFAYADNTVANDSVPTRLTIETGTNTRVERMSISSTGIIVFNETGVDADLRIEGDTDANLFRTDASTDRVGIGTGTPGYKLDVNGDINLPAASAYYVGGTAGVSGSFTTVDGKTVTVTKGITTSIV